MRILLAGASGLIGQETTRRAQREHEVRTLVRRPASSSAEYSWDPAQGRLPAEAIEWADAVISLSGASLARLPWTKRYRAEILRSRTETTALIAQTIRSSAHPPLAWVSGSAVGAYGNRPGETLDEGSAPGTGFLAEVVAQWEGATVAAASRTRVVHARTGLVIARRGALEKLILTTRLGLGARVGSGGQHWPWISLADEANALIHLATASAASGPVNLTGPSPATSRKITAALARALRRPHLFALPAPLLRLAMGAAADELLLADQDVTPGVLRQERFTWTHPTAESAVLAAIGGDRREQDH